MTKGLGRIGRYYVVLLGLLAFSAAPTRAQEAVPEKVQALDIWALIEAHAQPGGTYRLVYASEQDSATVWTNLQGAARIWRARVGGVRWARTLTGGTFPVSEELWQAYLLARDLDATFRARLDALLEDEPVVRQAANDE